MAKDAERLLAGTGWRPEPLRLIDVSPLANEPSSEVEALPDFLAGDEKSTRDEESDEPAVIAAE